MTQLPRRERRAARAVLLDPAGRVLLLRGRDPALPEAPSWWFTPGGGIRPGEEPLGALRRECWEELGLRLSAARGPLLSRVYEFPFDGAWLVQDTEYYAARVAPFRPAAQSLSEREARFILGWRWWSRAALTATSETIYPEDLADLLDRAEDALTG